MPLRLLKKKSLITKIIFFLFLFLTISIFFILNYFFIIKEIEIDSEKKIYLQGISFFKKKSLIFLNLEKAKKELLINNPLIHEITINKIYPNKLRIKIVLEKPVVALKTNNGFFYLNSNGKIIGKENKNDGLSLINFYQTVYSNQFNLGEKINYQEIILAINLNKRVKELGYQIDTIDIKARNMIVLKINGKEIFFNSEKDLESQVFQLKELLKRFEINGQEYKKIDLRFKNPVIE